MSLPMKSLSSPGRALSVPTPQDEFLALCLVMLSKNAANAPPPLKLSYKCSVCGKAFPSYQALGGHKSSHRRPSALVGPMRPVLAPFSGIIGPHRCNVCYRSFSTGQALGGHKRCHYWDMSLTTSGSTASGKGVRDIDLNFPAAPEMDRVEEGEEVMSPLPVKKLRLCD